MSLFQLAACTQVGDLPNLAVGGWQLRLKLSSMTLKNIPKNPVLNPFLDTNNMTICVCIIAAGSWEPVVASEYLIRESILTLGRLSTVCILGHTHMN